MAAGRREKLRELPPVEQRSDDRSSSPGDTLPWNLSKHQRVKRSKSASAEVLDPAERAVIRIAGMLALQLHPVTSIMLAAPPCIQAVIIK